MLQKPSNYFLSCQRIKRKFVSSKLIVLYNYFGSDIGLYQDISGQCKVLDGGRLIAAGRLVDCWRQMRTARKFGRKLLSFKDL